MLNQSPAALVQKASALIEARTGLSCHAQMRVNLEAILAELAKGDLPAFIKSLNNTPESAPGWQNLMRALVIGETYFFRNRVHFDLLGSLILPELAARGRKNLNIWSAGCATGEETYSIAMTLYENLPDLASRKIHLIGTDINNHAINAARAAVYRSWAFRQTENTFKSQYFEAVEGGFRIKPFIRSLATFRQTNLLAGPPLPQLDIIFCCNLLIYFEENAIEQAETMLFNALSPGGWLILGQAEALRTHRERWTTHIFPGAVAYEKPLTPANQTTIWQTSPSPKVKNGNSNGVITPATPIKLNTTAIYADAVALFRAENSDQAEMILTGVLADQPNHAAAHVLLACICANRGELKQAHAHLKTALKLDSLQADAYYLRGVLHLEAGDDRAAIEALRSALYCRRGHPLAAMILGSLYVRKGENDRARRTWKEALDVLQGQPATAPVCDLSDMTTESIMSFLSSQLESLA